MTLPLIRCDDLDAALAWRGGRPLSRRQYLADVAALAARLPAAGPMLNLSSDRYRFAVGLGAGMLRGHSNLMPPNHTPETLAQLQARFGPVYCLADANSPSLDLPTIHHAAAHAEASAQPVVPAIAASAITAQALTSGSTGAPLPHAKRWGLLVRNAQAGAERLAQQIGRPDLAGVALVATVPAQHMYGFESSVLVALQSGAAFDSARPFYPADIVRALERVPRPRLLVTTPFHLKTLLDAGVALAALDLLVCATAPLAPQLAARAEAAFDAPLLEIYGCTEAGQVATRRTTEGAEWRAYRDLQLTQRGEQVVVSGGHVPEPVALADVLELVDATRFRLLGRSNDLVNIAGRRSSIGHLNFHLNAIAGVSDGAFWLPPENGAEVVRLCAFVVAPDLSRERILGELRRRVDPAFLPRPIIHVAELPRDASGKLPAARLAQLAAAQPDANRSGLSSAPRTRQAESAPQGGQGNLGAARRFLESAPRTRQAESAPQGGQGNLGAARRFLESTESHSMLPIAIAADHPAFAGHFPGRPLLPGVALLSEVLEAALADPRLAAMVGRTPRIAVAKFLAPVEPGAALELHFDGAGRALRFELWHERQRVASGQFEIALADSALEPGMPAVAR